MTICRYNDLIYYLLIYIYYRPYFHTSRPTQPPILCLPLLAEPDRFHSSAFMLLINRSTAQCQHYSVKITNTTTLMAIYGRLCNRGGPLYFCPVVSFYLLLSIFLFFPRLISAAAGWMSTILPHMPPIHA